MQGLPIFQPAINRFILSLRNDYPAQTKHGEGTCCAFLDVASTLVKAEIVFRYVRPLWSDDLWKTFARLDAFFGDKGETIPHLLGLRQRFVQCSVTQTEICKTTLSLFQVALNHLDFRELYPRCTRMLRFIFQ